MRKVQLGPYTVIRRGLPYLRVQFQNRKGIYLHIAPLVYEPDYEARTLLLRLRRQRRTFTVGPVLVALKTNTALAAIDQDFPNGVEINMACEGQGSLDPVTAGISLELESREFSLPRGIQTEFLDRAISVLRNLPGNYYPRVRDLLLDEDESVAPPE